MDSTAKFVESNRSMIFKIMFAIIILIVISLILWWFRSAFMNNPLIIGFIGMGVGILIGFVGCQYYKNKNTTTHID